MPTTLYIVGDVRLHRDALALHLAQVPELEVVGAGPVAEAVPALAATPVDVALLDVQRHHLPIVVQALRGAPSPLKIVEIGVREAESEVLACAAAGVDGYVPMNASVADVAEVIASVMKGELICSPKVAASLYNSVAAGGTEDAVCLTDRELQVAELIDQGLSNKEISRRLSIEPCTAKNHIQNIMQKLGVHRRGQAAAKLRRSISRRFA